MQVTEACDKHGGFYLGSIGGPAAILASNSIKKVHVCMYCFVPCTLYAPPPRACREILRTLILRSLNRPRIACN